MAELTSIAKHSDWLDNQSMTVEEKWNCHRKRVEFGKQPLEIWQFVPCKLVDGVWVVLEDCDCVSDNGCCVKRNEYQQGKSLCLFEGFELIDEKQNTWIFKFKNETWFIQKDETIEFLTDMEITLTPASEKQIGL